MHELGIAYALLEQMEEILFEHHAAKAVSVTVVLGALSGVDLQAFTHCFEQAKRTTRFAETALSTQQIQLQAICKNCHATRDIDWMTTECPDCQSADIEMVGTHDITLQSMEVI